MEKVIKRVQKVSAAIMAVFMAVGIAPVGVLADSAFPRGLLE